MTKQADHDFIKAISQQPLLGDGAMGTWLFAKGVSADTPFEALNLDNKGVIEEVHLDYIRAGSELIQTNTFAANRYALQPYGIEDRVWDVNVWGAKVARAAREISGENVFVAGSIGPLTKPIAPLGPITAPEARTAFKEQAEGLLAGGVDLFVVETLAGPDEAVEAISAIRDLCQLPVVAEFSFSTDLVTGLGHPVEACLSGIFDADVVPDVIGVNCGAGAAVGLEAVRQMRHWLDGNVPELVLPLSVVPNAGLPARVGGRLMYMTRPDYYARFVGDYIAAGARLIGGCCGTTPEHILALRHEIDRLPARVGTQAGEGSDDSDEALDHTGRLDPPSSAMHIGNVPPPVHVKEQHGAQAWKGTSLRDKLGQQFVISVELDPPKGAVPHKFLTAAEALRDAGVDAINVADSPMARVRMGALAGCHLVTEQTGVATIAHFTTRDRNLMGIQSDLLGAHALGVRNILALTGDPPSLGNSRATAVYDVDSIGLIHILRELNQGVDIGGNPIGEPTDFTIGCALSPNAEDLELELDRYRRKTEAGANFTMTQPLYDLDPLRRVLDRLGEVPVPILLGIMPLHSAKHADYLHNEVPGISIPKRVRDALNQAKDAGVRVGMELAAELVREAREMVSGIYVVLSFGKYEEICGFIRQLRQEPDFRQEASNAREGN